MKLTRFRVKDFRAVVDTGWIDCQNITAFAGENESGKTTLLIALLKLAFNDKNATEQNVYKRNQVNMAMINIPLDFPIERRGEDLGIIVNTTFAYAEFELTNEMRVHLRKILPNFKENRVIISRKYSGEYTIDILEQYTGVVFEEATEYILGSIPRFMYYQEVFELNSTIDFISLALKLNKSVKNRNLTAKETMVSNLLDALDIWESNLIKSIAEVYQDLSTKTRKEVDFRVIFDKLPLFRARVERGFEKFNKEFLRWWGKTDITITFEPYEKGIVIKIKDASGQSYRLENRSTGFRRFFSMFLSFSIVHRSEYENSVLLFDEAGAALHPLTQRMLADFFNVLGDKTQILFNTHTSYMLNVAHMNRVRLVYKDPEGHVVVNESLTINKDRTNEMSLFPVQSAFAHYVAEKAMAGCWPIVVLSESDENYLSLTKNMLIAKGALRSIYNISVFATGENGIDAACKLFSDGDDYPMVLLPSDPASKIIKKRLIGGIYKKCPKKVMEIADFSHSTTFEHLIPTTFVEMFSRKYLTSILGQGFVYNKNKDLIQQIEEYAIEKKIELPANYRAEIAKRMKMTTMSQYKNIIIPGKYTSTWKAIWAALLSEKPAKAKKEKNA